MAIRVNATLRIGGTLARSHLDNFVATIAEEHAFLDWDGQAFEPDLIEQGKPLVLVVNDIIGGELCAVEAFCQRHHLPFTRWSGGHAEFGPVRVVFDGVSKLREFPATIDDEILISLDSIRCLGTFDAIEKDFAFANRIIPPFHIAPDNGQASTSAD